MGDFVFVRQLNPTETTKAIRLRLVRTYELPEKGKPNSTKSKECLFHDAEGVFVHAHIPKEFVPRFRSSFIEGQIYSIQNFFPVTNFFRYKTTKTKYMIKFNKNTKVFDQVYDNNNPEFPRHMFRLRTFESFLQAGQIDDKELIDVIGRVVKIYKPMEVPVEGIPCKLIDFIIEDNRDNRVLCTVWDKHVQALLAYYDCNPPITVIVLLQLCRAFRQDNGQLKLSSSYDATRVLVNHECPEVDDFKLSLREPENLTTVSSMSTFSGGNIFDDLTSNDINLTTICAVYNKHQVGECSVIAKIVGIETDKDWFYTSCMNNKCRKKITNENGNFFCNNCNKSWPQGILKYKVQLRVYDGVDDAALLLWDRACAELLGISAYNLNRKYLESDDLPAEIEKLCGKWLIFKINVTTEHLENPGKAIPINRVITDETMIAAKMPNYLESQDQDLNSILEQEKEKDAEDVASGDEVDSPIILMGNKFCNPDEPQTSNCKRKLMDQFSSTHSMNKAQPIVVKKEKLG